MDRTLKATLTSIISAHASELLNIGDQAFANEQRDRRPFEKPLFATVRVIVEGYELILAFARNEPKKIMLLNGYGLN